MMRRFKVFLRRFSIEAPRLSVRPQMPWYVHWLRWLLAAVVIGAIAWCTYDVGLEYAGFRQNEARRVNSELGVLVRDQQKQLADVHAKLAAAERQLQMEHATYEDLAKQVKTLSQENSALKEDLAFFQSLTATGKTGAISVNRFRLMPEGVPGEYRYRLLLVQTGERAKEFTGSMQLVLNLQINGRKTVVVWPEESKRTQPQYRINIKFFQRVEGVLKIPVDAQILSLQVRIFEGQSDTPKLTHDVNL